MSRLHEANGASIVLPATVERVNLTQASTEFQPLPKATWMHIGNADLESFRGGILLRRDEVNDKIVDLYWRYKSDQNISIGFYKLRNCIILDNWGLVVRDRTDLLNLSNGFGWSPEHISYMEQKGYLYVKGDSIDLKFPQLQIKNISGLSCLMSFPGALTYGHWIVDLWGRVEILKRMGVFFEIEHFIFPAPTAKWMEKFFHIFEIPQSRVILVDKTSGYEVSNLIVPTVPSQSPGGILPLILSGPLYSRWCNIFNTWMDNEVRKKTPLFLRHTPLTSGADRVLSNAHNVEQVVEAHGGVIVDPLKTPLSHVISHIQNASIVIGQDSSVLHNVAFVGRDLIVIETAPRGNLLHISIQEATGYKISYMKADEIDGKWHLDTNRLSSLLNDL